MDLRNNIMLNKTTEAGTDLVRGKYGGIIREGFCVLLLSRRN